VVSRENGEINYSSNSKFLVFFGEAISLKLGSAYLIANFSGDF
jgi:hypothetical protein